MAYGLTRRIFKHALSESWIKPGDVVVDPFGGIGSTGIVGASLGLRVVCVELEEKFCRLAGSYDCPGITKKEWVRWFNRFDRNQEICPNCQTNVRSWCENDYNIPFRKSHHYVGNFERNRKVFEVGHFGHGYPPQIIQGDSRKLSEVIAGANCVIGSPPFCESSGARAKPDSYKGFEHVGSVKHKDNDTLAGYGRTPGNLGNLKPGKVDSIISSPPYERSIQTNGDGIDWSKIKEGGTRKTAARASIGMGYGKIKGQLAEAASETFWAAAKQIVSECHKILKPGGHAIWVVKAFVRKGAIVDFPGDWRRLCEAQGFQTVCVHHAMLVKEKRHQSLFGHEIVETKSKKSFFKRLCESKGSPPIDYETVLCMKKGT